MRPCWGNTAFRIWLQRQQNGTLAAGCLPATKSWWCVGANAGGDAGSDRGGDRGGSTWSGLCWCCKPVLLEVPAWHSQLLQMEQSNKMIDEQPQKTKYILRNDKNRIFDTKSWGLQTKTLFFRSPQSLKEQLPSEHTNQKVNVDTYLKIL